MKLKDLWRKIFKKKEEEPVVKRDPLQKKLHKKKIKQRRAMQGNKDTRREYRCKQRGPEYTFHKTSKATKIKRRNKPKDATQTWYYRSVISKELERK